MSGSRSSSSAPVPPESRSRARSASSRCGACARDFRTLRPASVRVVLLDGGKEPLADVRRPAVRGAPRRELERLGVELRMGARVTGVDASRCRRRRPTGGTRAHRRPHGGLGRRRAGVAARRRSSPRRRARTSTAPGASRCCPTSRCPATPRCSRSATWPRSTTCPASPRSPCRAACTPRTRSGAASTATLDAMPFKYRDLGSVADDRTVPCHLQRARDPAQRLPGMDRLAVRAPRVPQRLRESVHDRCGDGSAR